MADESDDTYALHTHELPQSLNVMDSAAASYGPVPLWPPKQQGAWECPRCHKVNAPHVDQCSCEAPASNVGSPATIKVYDEPPGGS